MPAINFKSWIPHLVIIAIMALISLAVCMPALQGQVLTQHDVLSWKAMSQEAKTFYEKTGQIPLWSNSMFGGNPTYLVFMGTTSAYFAKLYVFLTYLLPQPANFFFVALLSFYVLSQVLRMNRWLGLLGALGFAFSAYNPIILSAGHNTKMVAIAWMPLVMAGFVLLYRGKWVGGCALFAPAMALMTLSGHYQIVYYMGLILLFTGIGYLVDAIRKGTLPRFFKASVLAVVMGVLGVSVNAVGILPTREYNEYTMRGGKSELTLNKAKGEEKKADGGLDKEYAFRWSQGLGETFTLLVPDLYGGGSSEAAERFPETSAAVGPQYEKLPGYWGDQPYVTGADHYLGAIICFLAILGLVVIRNPMKWALAAAALFGIILGLGRNLPSINYFLFDHLPMLKNFRTPSMALVMPQLIFPVLGIWGVHQLMQEPDAAKKWKAIKLSAGITAGLALLLALGGSLFFAFTNPATDAQLPPQLLSLIREDRAALARNSGLRSAFFILAAAGVLWALVKEKLNAMTALIGLAVLTFADLQTVGSRYLNSSNYEEPSENEAAFAPRPVDAQILADKDPYFRVLDMSSDPYNNAVPAYHHKLVGGYSPAKMESYQDLIDIHLNPQKGLNGAVLNMLNTKYIIGPMPDGQLAAEEQKGALGNAWFVSNVKYVNTADEEMLAMNSAKWHDTAAPNPAQWNPRQTAIVRAQPFQQTIGKSTFSTDSAAAIRLTKYGLNELSFESKNANEGLAVFADIYYDKGWKAFVDGKETPIVRANYILRGVKLPAGQHKIDFKFEPQSFKTGNTISAVSSLILFALVAFGLFYAWKQSGKSTSEIPPKIT